MNINLTLFGQMVTFAIFVWFCMKFVWPVIIGAMEERQQKIADGLDAAINAGATACIQPGGSIRDEEVIAAADEAGMAMVLTNHRHFRH